MWIRSLWDTMLLALQHLAREVVRESQLMPAPLDCGRATVTGMRCIETISSSSAPEEVRGRVCVCVRACVRVCVRVCA